MDLPDLHHGKSALMMACKLQLNSSSSERGSQPHAVVTLLLNNGASLSATDFKGNSVLPWAIAYGTFSLLFAAVCGEAVIQMAMQYHGFAPSI